MSGPGPAPTLRLTLMRHGRAEGNDPRLADFDRSLDRRGISEVIAMGQRMAGRGRTPELLLASPAARTVQTAQILLREFDGATVELRLEPRLYLASADTLLESIRQRGGQTTHLMLVGHNPGITDFARWLAPGFDLPGFETAATCTLTLQCASWDTLGAAMAREAHPDRPGIERVFSTNRRG